MKDGWISVERSLNSDLNKLTFISSITIYNEISSIPEPKSIVKFNFVRLIPERMSRFTTHPPGRSTRKVIPFRFCILDGQLSRWFERIDSVWRKSFDFLTRISPVFLFSSSFSFLGWRRVAGVGVYASFSDCWIDQTFVLGMFGRVTGRGPRSIKSRLMRVRVFGKEGRRGNAIAKKFGYSFCMHESFLFLSILPYIIARIFLVRFERRNEINAPLLFLFSKKKIPIKG